MRRRGEPSSEIRSGPEKRDRALATVGKTLEFAWQSNAVQPLSAGAVVAALLLELPPFARVPALMTGVVYAPMIGAACGQTIDGVVVVRTSGNLHPLDTNPWNDGVWQSLTSGIVTKSAVKRPPQ